MASVLLQYVKQKRAQLASLGEWTHINCLRPGAVERVEDDMLTHLIYSPSAKKKAPPKGSQSRLLDAVDQIMDDDARSLSRDDLPGGSVSFLFERTTKAIANDEDAEDE